MASWRNLGILIVVLAVARPGQAQTYTLTESPRAGDCFRIHLEMKLAGEARVPGDDGPKTLPLSATADDEFAERVLATNPAKAVRLYEAAKVVIGMGKDKSERTLRPDCRLIVAQRVADQLITYCPDGPLSRAELEVTQHLDTLALTGLLPGKAVSVGQTWKLPNAVVQALCSLEGMESQDLTGKLESVSGEEARIVVTGSASGIDLGALVKLTVRAVCRYDLKQQRVMALEWKQKDEREQGPVSPAASFEATTTIARRFQEEQPKGLSDYDLVNIPDDPQPPAENLTLLYQDPQDRFTLVHAREWHLTARTEEHLTLRLMDRGDFVADVTVTPWTKAEAGKHLSGAEFKQFVDDQPDWESDEVREDGELNLETGYWAYRVSALGDLDGLKVLQNCYLIAGPEGDQVVLAFKMRPAQADKFGTRDLTLLRGLELPKKK